MNSISKFSFYYILPLTMGFSIGLILRDHTTNDINKKVSMSLANYYEFIDEEVEESMKDEYPEVSKLIHLNKN